MEYINSIISQSILPWCSSKGAEILWALIIGIIGWWVINKASKLIVIFMQRAGMEQSIITFLNSLLLAALKVILILMILPHIGIDTSSIVTALGVSLAAVGLALKDSLSNVASGVLIIMCKPFCVGDFIKSGNISGTIVKIEMMFTTLMDSNSKTIIIPNSKLTSEIIVRTGDHNIECITLEYDVQGDCDIDAIKRVFQKTLMLNDKILQIPPAEISVNKTQDDTQTIKLEFWAEKIHQEKLKDSIDKTIKGFLAKHKLDIL